MTDLLKTFTRNTVGQDWAVGDIHGHFSHLQKALDAIGFDPAVDRLFSVGDLVDRGPESDDAVKWLDKPWFHAVRGNHDDYVCRFDTCDIGNWMHNGGVWFVGKATDEKQNFQVLFNDLPIAIEVETDAGLVGIVHADCPFESWHSLQFELTGQTSSARLKQVKNSCMWSRSRFDFGEMHGVKDVRAVVCGHNPTQRPRVLGNVWYIDTMGWLPGEGVFTFLNLAELEIRDILVF